MEDVRTRLLQESDQYAEMMFWNNNYYEDEFGDSFSEVSSGYESTGSYSDSESFSSEESRVCPKRPISSHGRKSTFESVQPLCNSLELILSMPDMCDVTFVVGPEQIPVHGVKAILACRSRKMFELIITHQSMKTEDHKSKKKISKKDKHVSKRNDKLVIPVKKFDAVVFKEIVRFIHCGSVNLTDETVAGLFCGASQFELEDLRKACQDYIKRRVQDRDLTTILSSIRKYSHHKTSTVLLEMVYDVTENRIKKYREISV